MPAPRAMYPTVAESEECRQILVNMAETEKPQALAEVLTEFTKVTGKQYCQDAAIRTLQRSGWTYHRMRFGDGSQRRVWLPPTKS